MTTPCAARGLRLPLSHCLTGMLLLALGLGVWGCGPRRDHSALDPDANGFVCLDCKTKFYTSRKIYANHCPSCQNMNIEFVMGYVCPADGAVSYGPRGRGAMPCQQCGKVTRNLSMPSEEELKGWGAMRQDGPAVGVH